MTKQATPSASCPSVDQLCVSYFDTAKAITYRMVQANPSLRNRLLEADLPSYASSALLDAATRWDPERSNDFEAWLRVSIRFRLQEAAREEAPVGRHGMSLLQELVESEERLGTDASPEAVARDLGWTPDRVVQVRRWRESSHEPVSLEDGLSSGVSPSAEEEAVERIWVEDALNQIPESERAVLFLHYFEGVPFTVIAEKLQLPKSNVSRIHTRAKQRMRTHLQAA